MLIKHAYGSLRVEYCIGYILVGACIGFLSGIFGIGGSLISTPILRLLFGMPEMLALATPLPVTIPTAISGAYSYWRRGLVRKRISAFSIIGGLPATVVGAYLTKFVSGSLLMVFTGVFVIIVGLRMLFASRLHNSNIKFSQSFLAFVSGILAGFMSGFLAIGGGIVLVPAYIIILGLSMQEAAASSLICIAFFAVPGTIVHCMLGHVAWKVVLCLSAGVIPASYLGAMFGMSVKSKPLQIAFSIFLILFGAYFIFKQC